MNDRPLVSVVVVTYKSRSFIDRCLAPFDGRSDIQIVVVENASGDGLADHVRTRFPQAKMIESSENLGFARGNNRAFEHCTGRYILLLNPDAFVPSAETIESLANYLELHEDVGAVGPQLINEDGSHQTGDAGWRISARTVLSHAFMIQRLISSAPSLYLTNRTLLKRAAVDVDWIRGACMMIRAEVITTVGGMDETVFMYGEDIEWGTRIRDTGWRVVLMPQLKVLHLQGATQKVEGQAFSSTKWLDDAMTRYARIGNRTGHALLKAALTLGYGSRAVLWITGAIMLNHPKWRSKGDAMWRYARHAASLPSFSAAKGVSSIVSKMGPEQGEYNEHG